MTAYHGGKQRIGKKIANKIYKESILLSEEDDFKIKGYCEPFAGMLGVYQHIPELFKQEGYNLKYKAGDINKSVIMMWKSAQRGWKPPVKSSEKQYNQLKHSKDSAIRGYIGHQYSFGGKFFDGYAPKYGKTIDSTRASNKVVNISKTLKNIIFTHALYTQFSKLKGYIIYCDPPYFNTVNRYYDGVNNKKQNFEHTQFWNWCRYMAKDNIIFVSSYNAPKDFSVIFSSTHKLTGIGSANNNKKRTEKLYVL
jgi:hypothetical protein